VLRARAEVQLTTRSDWRGTRTRIGDQITCADTADHDSGRKAESYDVTAPSAPGSYDAAFSAWDDDDCQGTMSPQRVLRDAIRVTAPVANPNLPPRCGIEVMLVLDESRSIQSSGATETVRDAARAFLAAMAGTGAEVSIVDFGTSAARRIDYTDVTSDSIADVFEPYLVRGYKPKGSTNWEAAFQEVREANAAGPVADLVVLVTDGDPTARNHPPGRPVADLVEGEAEALRRAAQQADLVKDQGSHVLALGVGAAVTNPASARRLTAISGPGQYPGAAFSSADYTLLQDFDDLGQALRRIAIELCRASVTLTNLVDEGDGRYRPDPGWRFTATVSTRPGGYAWLQPPPSATGPRSDTTDEDGVVTFQWRSASAGATSTVTVSEDLRPGYEFVDADCTVSAPGITRRRVIRDRTPEETTGMLRPGEYARCTVRNRILPGTIDIEKDATPDSARAFEFAGSDSLGPFALVDDGKDESASSRTFAGLVPGTYTVRESVPEGWELSGVTCSDPAVAIAGPEVTIAIGPGDSVVCTYRDARLDTPSAPFRPGPTLPPSLAPPGSPATPAAPAPPPSTVIEVVKTAPRVARVGQKVPFELAVSNTGSVAAQDVMVADVPPAALTLAGLQSGGPPARLVRGNAVWRLGTLAPGARRTIRGTVAIRAGTPGLKRNLVLATAVNAQLARDDADTPLLVKRRVIPPVTG
jgi:uncharacterized repeat protein (TIGR01451 family)